MTAKRQQSHKLNSTIIIVIIVALVAIIGGISYLIWHNNQTPEVIDTTVSVEQAPHYGACELTTTNTIKESLEADRIITIQEGERIGEKQLNGTTGEGCMFKFSTKESNANTLTTSVYDYMVGDENGGKVEIVGEDWSEVAGSSPVAYFGEATENNGQTKVFMYRVLPGSKNILIALRQPSNALTYNRDAAFNFIGGIAASLNLSAVDAKINGGSDEPFEPGGITDNP
ncbi:MAG: hypothetical protein ACREGE_01875 [Candidatus Microsaccharimonas sp.]